jgi:hypothetical protein
MVWFDDTPLGVARMVAHLLLEAIRALCRQTLQALTGWGN